MQVKKEQHSYGCSVENNMRKYLKEITQQSALNNREIKVKIVECMGIIRNISMSHKYQYQSPELIGFYKSLGLPSYDAFHKILLLSLIDSFKIEDIALKLPSSMAGAYKKEFDRIIGLVKEGNFDFNWGNDLFIKDLAICCGRLVPIGPAVIGISGIPRILYFRGGIRQFLKLVYLIDFKLKSRKPLLCSHLHMPNIKEFNKDIWTDYYITLGEILALNPDIKGLMRSAWFFDPAIAIISPKLADLANIPLKHGADAFFYGPEGKESGALAKSKTRIALFNQGKYIPKTYYLIWPRKSLIKYGIKYSSDKEV